MSAQAPDVFDFRRELAKELVTHTNIKQEVVITTVDKLKLCLIEHKGHLRSRREWLGPLGLTVALVASLVAAEFHAALGLTAATWEALFLLSAVGAGALTIFLVGRALVNWKRGGVEELIDKIAARTGGGLPSDVYASVLSDLLNDMYAVEGERTAGTAKGKPKK